MSRRDSRAREGNPKGLARPRSGDEGTACGCRMDFGSGGAGAAPPPRQDRLGERMPPAEPLVYFFLDSAVTSFRALLASFRMSMPKARHASRRSSCSPAPRIRER